MRKEAQDPMELDLDADVIRHARVLPLDVVAAKGGGHAGTAVSLTPALYVLFQEVLVHDPADPSWRGRDRFVLSCGHASLGLYVQLYLSGYGLEMEDLRLARTFGSATPGHPEFGHTRGVETTTGPLGQGIGNAVGMAMEAARLRTLLGTDLFSGHVWCVASDGDLQEGVSHEASSLAGTLGLSGLVLIWDDNGISIEGDTSVTFAEDVVARYRAYGWAVLEIPDGEDVGAIRAAFVAAREITDRPVFIRLRTQIGHPMATLAGTAAAHAGALPDDEVLSTKALLGLDPSTAFHVPPELLDHARRVGVRGAAARAVWDRSVANWEAEHAAETALLARLERRDTPEELAAVFSRLRAAPEAAATRVTSSVVLNAVAPLMPELWGGSADLAESNGTLITGATSFVPSSANSAQWPGGAGGQLLHFGIREHAMGAIMNGIALGGLTRVFGATFFVFSDYLRPSVRLAALMNLPVTYVWSHDSVAVGEDGPTHQPVEHLWAARGIVNLAVVRPADALETIDAWRRLLERPNGPVAIVLSRQALPVVSDGIDAADGAVRGAYVLRREIGERADAVIIATGSEVALAVEAADRVRSAGLDVRVVSAPCLEWFQQESQEYQDSVLPPDLLCRVSVEAGTDLGWPRWVGTHGRSVAIDDYGHSGAGDLVLANAGISVEAVVAAVQAAISDVASVR